MTDRNDPMKGKRRSSQWWGKADKDGFAHRSWMKNQGFPAHLFDGRPVIGIANTFSEFNPCNAHFRKIAEHVKRGIYEAGGFPVEFPVFSNSESQLRPTAMLYRNLASMDVEEAIRGLPMDGVVLLVGCDKTTPALLMGAASCDLPTICVSGGPMLNGHYKNEKIGSGTHIWKFSEAVRGGQMTMEDFLSAEAGNSRSAGHCMTMGTASTMASMAESLGMTLPGNAAIPAVDSRRYVLAHMSGMRAVEMVIEDLRLSKILTKQAFENAIVTNGAIGGSTNAVVHLLAIAGRVGVDLSLDDWDRLGQEIPCLLNLMPSGEHLMEDFYYAGGLPAILREIGGFLNKDAVTANGKTIWENVKDAPCYNRDVVFELAKPFKPTLEVGVLVEQVLGRGANLPGDAAQGIVGFPPEVIEVVPETLALADFRPQAQASADLQVARPVDGGIGGQDQAFGRHLVPGLRQPLVRPGIDNDVQCHQGHPNKQGFGLPHWGVKVVDHHADDQGQADPHGECDRHARQGDGGHRQ